MANRTERYGIRGAQCAPKLRTGGAEDDSWHGRTRTGADLQGVGGELPPAAPRHGGRPLQQRRRRSRKEAGGPWDQRRACCIAVPARDPEPAAEEGNPSAPARPPRRVACVRRGAEPRTGSLEHWRRGLAVWGERKGDVVKTRSEGLRPMPRLATALDSSSYCEGYFFHFYLFFFLFFPLLVLQKTFD